jgi:hypothetical protein
VPPKLTIVVAVKLVPVIVTVEPVAAETGVKDAIVGAWEKSVVELKNIKMKPK